VVSVAQVIDVTDGRFADTDPVFTLDGRYLAFLSERSFDPVYDTQSFDLAFPFGTRPFLVPLAAATPSPFGPLPDGRPLEPGSGSGDDGDDNPADSGAPPDVPETVSPGIVVHVDPDDIAARIVG